MRHTYRFLFSLLLCPPGFSQVASVPLEGPYTPGPSVSRILPGGRVSWLTGLAALGDPARQNDFPSAAAAPNGDVWVAWTSYGGLREEIHVRRYSEGSWYSAFPVPGVSGDVWNPQVAVDGKGHPWVVWSQQGGYPGDDKSEPNWDLYAARLEGNRWIGPERLTDHPLPDIGHRFISDARGRLWLSWQGFRQGQSDIFLRSWENGTWADAAQVSSDAGNDWAPDVAVDSAGGVTVVWDTYRSGNYDVRMRTLRNGQWESEAPVADSISGEANASAVYDAQDRLWIAYEDLGVNWTKDSGGRTLGVKRYGSAIGQQRNVRVKILQNGRWMKTEGEVSKAITDPQNDFMSGPRLAADKGGRVWLTFRHRMDRYSTWTWAVDSRQVPNASGIRSYFNTYITHYDGSAWVPATELPRSRGRMMPAVATAPAANGQLWVFWHTDNRDDSQVHIPGTNQVWSCVLTPPTPPLTYKLASAQEPKMSSVELSPASEAEDVRNLRAAKVEIGGRSYRLFKGDLHRHTEFSTDSGPRADGSILDFFRYMIDAAEMDFGAITDHSGGGDDEYWWWLIQKVTDMYQVPGRYVSLFGYERTPHYPFGHKNIIHARRNVPVVRLFTRPDIAEHWSTYAIITSDLVENDTELLYEELRRSGGIAIPHTLATSQGNDWKHIDEKVQPVAEIFQGARASYEHEGAPGGHTRNPAAAEDLNYRPDGFLWKAWEQGVRIGVIASSDHRSTHLSFAMVYSADATRSGLIEAIRARRTYGATDNILLEYSMGDHFMGEEFTATKVPEIRIRVRGTAPVANVSVIRNGKYVGQFTPNTQEAAFQFRDNQPLSGSSHYYVRVEQANGHLAWSSPIWVNVR